MKAFDLNLNSTFVNKPLEKGTYFFRLDYKYVLQMNNSITGELFMENIQNQLNDFNKNKELILNKMKELEIEFKADDENQVWQNPYKDIIISSKGLIASDNFEDVINKLNEIKKNLQLEKILLKIHNYVDFS